MAGPWGTVDFARLAETAGGFVFGWQLFEIFEVLLGFGFEEGAAGDDARVCALG